MLALVVGLLGVARCDSTDGLTGEDTGIVDEAGDDTGTVPPGNNEDGPGTSEDPGGEDPEAEPGEDAEGEDPENPDPGEENFGGELPPLPDLRIRLVSRLPLAGEDALNTDVWGFVNPQDGKRYALVGGLSGSTSQLYVVDASNPEMPALRAAFPAPGFDMKVWKHYAYTVTGSGDRTASAPEGRILDLSTPANPRTVGAFPSGHNVFIDEQGYLYLSFPGLRIFDLNPDPTNPVPVWDDGAPNGGHDATVIGNRLYDFHGTGGTRIYDVSDRRNPLLLGSINDPSIAFHHSGWTSEDGRYLFICDEGSIGSNPDVTVWDIREPDNPTRVAAFGDDNATVHNLYIEDDLAFVSYYSAGFRVYDVADPTQPRLLDEFDTDPGEQGAGLNGAWGVYPFARFGYIYVSDVSQGLFVFSLEPN